jgi:hypothetical protein
VRWLGYIAASALLLFVVGFVLVLTGYFPQIGGIREHIRLTWRGQGAYYKGARDGVFWGMVGTFILMTGIFLIFS